MSSCSASDGTADTGYLTAPNKRMRPHLKMSGAYYRPDETYVKVGKEWKYPYRAVDSSGQTPESKPSAKRDISAAKRFFKKMMRADFKNWSSSL